MMLTKQICRQMNEFLLLWQSISQSSGDMMFMKFVYVSFSYLCRYVHETKTHFSPSYRESLDSGE
jgi:hypothetical protein